MIDLQKFRRAVAAHLGRELTPEVAAAIEVACRASAAPIDLAAFGQHEHAGYVIRAERMADVLDELHPLHAAHWLETEKHRHGLPLAPDYLYMMDREVAGTMVQFTARHGRELVGNLRLYLGVSKHSGTKFAEEDTLFIAPAHRGGMLAVALLRFAERAVLSLGVREIRADSKLVNKADVLMRRMGYEAVATKFVKVFKEGQHVL